jgi:Zn-dependent M32 family carboxypeptidase
MWLIYVEVEYLAHEWTETFKNEGEAEERYQQLLEEYKDGITKNTVEVHFGEVKKSSTKN